MKKRLALILAIAMLCMALMGCDSSDYKKACALYEEGSYAEAAELFEGLGDYEDSADRAMDSKYMNAETLFAAGEYEAAATIYEGIASYKDAEAKGAEARMALMRETYADVFAALDGGVWFYEATSVNAVNVVKFTADAAILNDVYYDGNGPHVTAEETCSFIVDDANIVITRTDGSTLAIAYALAGDQLDMVCDMGALFTPQQVDEALQGYWGIKKLDFVPIIGLSASEYIYLFEDGKVTYESANPAYGYNDGTYYYYGPNEGTYTITANGIESDVKNSWQLGFTISGGQVVANRCGDALSPYEGFKGQDGFSF